MSEEYCVLNRLPNDGQKCWAFGHKTFCCKEDMEEEPAWHEVTFKFVLSEYKIKENFPNDIEESVLQFCNFVERWIVDGDEPHEHVIGVIPIIFFRNI